MVEDYEHNGAQVDLILISHVMYYCIENYYDIMKKNDVMVETRRKIDFAASLGG